MLGTGHSSGGLELNELSNEELKIQLEWLTKTGSGRTL